MAGEDTQQLREWLLVEAGIHTKLLDKMVDLLDDSDVVVLQDLHVLRDTVGLQTIFKPVSAAKIAAALDRSSATHVAANVNASFAGGALPAAALGTGQEQCVHGLEQDLTSDELASETSMQLLSAPADAASGRGSGLGGRTARMPFPLYSFRRERAARCIQRLWRMPSDFGALFSSYSTRVQALERQWDEWLYEQNMMRLAHSYRGGARSGASGRYSRLQAPLPGGTSRPRRGVARSHALVATGSPEAADELDCVVYLAPSTNSTTSAFSTAERVHDELSRAPSSVPTVGSVLAHTTPEGYPGMCSYSSHHGPSHDAMRSFISSDPSGVFDVDTYWDG